MTPAAEGPVPVHEIAKPYLLLVGDMTDRKHCKTALGLKDWRRADCVGQLRFSDEAADIGVPDMNIAEARAAGARTVVIGITPAGGKLPETWYSVLIDALEAGLDIASGLHVKLADVAPIAERARALGRKLHDVRHSPGPFEVGSGRKRAGKRMLTIGTDCAVGKKYTALAIAAELGARGVNAAFRATGQTGILIAGRGIAIDAVVADFVSGAAEAISPANSRDHWDIIEGQGSLYHPSFAAVTTGLVVGSQPDVMVLCHNPHLEHVADHPDYPIPSFTDAITLYESLARITNRAARVAGLSLNTSGYSNAAAADLLAAASAETGLPAFDPVRNGPGVMLDTMDF